METEIAQLINKYVEELALMTQRALVAETKLAALQVESEGGEANDNDGQ